MIEPKCATIVPTFVSGPVVMSGLRLSIQNREVVEHEKDP